VVRGWLWQITGLKKSERRLRAERRELSNHLADVWHLHILEGRLLATMELVPLLEEVLAAVTALQSAEMGVVRLFDDARGELEAVVGKGLPPEYLDRFRWLPIGDEPCGLALEGQGSVIVEDVATDPRAAGWTEAAKLGGYRAGFNVPLIGRGGNLVGTVAAFFHEPHRPTKWQAHLTEHYLLQAADAIANVQTHQALRESDRRKDEFLAMLAHELRNPLSAIQTCAHLLQHGALDAPSFVEVRGAIVRQSRHMSQLVEDLLDATRISRGSIPLRKERVGLAEIVARAIEDVRPLIAARGHHFTIALPDRPVSLKADPIRLEQVLANLLTNAVKYTDPGGRIELVAERDDDDLVLIVRDTGIGMTSEALRTVFDLFTQVETGSARSAGGLGIGLALVKNLVELHGGSVEARSEGPGMGSEFIVRLPVLRDRPSDRPDRQPAGDRPLALWRPPAESSDEQPTS